MSTPPKRESVSEKAKVFPTQAHNALAISIERARVHNLRNVSLDIPRGKLVVITGLSGSGKSSLALDTIFAEGQRQYIESLSVYSRRFLNQLERPDVDQITGLQPTIAIDQRGAGSSQNFRSTVATITEIYDYMRLLFARLGQAHCYKCGRQIKPQSVEQILEDILALPENSRIMLLAPMVRGRRGAHKDVLRKILKAGFVRARIDGNLVDVENLEELDPHKVHDIEAVIDRLVLKEGVQSRLSESLKLAIQHGEGVAVCVYEKERIANSDGTTRSVWKDILFSTLHSCAKCRISFPEIESRTFSFNSPYGACPACLGLGTKYEFDFELLFPDPILSFKNGALAPWKLLTPAAQQFITSHLDAYFLRKLEEPSFREKYISKNDNKKRAELDVLYKTPICEFDDEVRKTLKFGESLASAHLH
ncbi:MAG: hypothetical protein ACRC2T_10835, partial [Thermoguttaceae bacterium]